MKNLTAATVFFAVIFAAPGWSAQLASSNVPPAVSRASNLGHADPSQIISVRVWLTLRNEAAFDSAVEQLYNPRSPTYHQWMTAADFARYAPTAAQVAAVKRELTRNGLTIANDVSDLFSIKATGTVAQVEGAFHTQIQNFSRDGRKFYANVVDASLAGEAANLVSSVTGLDNISMRPLLKQATDPRTGKALLNKPLAKNATPADLSQYVTNKCFSAPASVTLTSNGSLPTGVFFGNAYDTAPVPCGYGAADVQAAYGLTEVYAAGYRGGGQTIVVVDPYGSKTIEEDANAFSALNGLPPLDSSNFSVVYPDGPPLYFDTSWITETSLDVEWVHAIAPRAKIILLSPPSQDDQEFQYAIEFAAMHRLGSVISNSYGIPEVLHGPLVLNAYNTAIKFAAATGIAVNYASGDAGDEGLGTPVGASLAPADSPYATSVGGTSLGIPNGTGGTFETGWGNNQTILSFGTNFVLDPPYTLGFYAGGGGGESVFFPKPAFQSALSGSGRLQPDVAALADPYTGGVFVYSFAGTQYLGVIGGTSLATPIFSGIWALATQKHGHWLGQAAPLIAAMPPDALHDIVPVGNPANAAGVIFDSNGPTYYSPASLLAPLETTAPFVSALWNVQGSGEYVALSFGTDTSLQTAPGWDDVTGYGTPNGLAFITAAAAGK